MVKMKVVAPLVILNCKLDLFCMWTLYNITFPFFGWNEGHSFIFFFALFYTSTMQFLCKFVYACIEQSNIYLMQIGYIYANKSFKIWLETNENFYTFILFLTVNITIEVFFLQILTMYVCKYFFLFIVCTTFVSFISINNVEINK